ncbi:PIR Superfamily Protein [Plasmodium ovale curtisi]|nr:PIR Superfamily Protein [Plasmodium ovale curtisi]
METAVGDYDIFEYLEEYLQKEDIIKYSDDTYNIFFCFLPNKTSFLFKHDVMNLCKKFVILFEKLKDAYQHDASIKEIYKECYTSKSSSTYCTVYNQCNQQLDTALFTIKDNIRAYLVYETTPAKILAPQNLSGETALHVNEEDIASSNTASINVVIGVSSWLNRTVLNRGDSMYNYDKENKHAFLDNDGDFN